MDIPQRATPCIEQLREYYLGKDIHEVPSPALVLDLSVVRRHCSSVLAAVNALGVDFRAHIKTHKTTQLAHLQVGDAPRDAKFVVSTIAEIEYLLPLVAEYQKVDRKVNILYGIPLPPSQSRRLARLAQKLGPGVISALVDHPAQLDHINTFFEITHFPLGIFIKIDTGYHRAGLPATALNKGGLLERLMKLQNAGHATFLGLYSHNSLSYNNSTPKEAMYNLAAEIDGCIEALQTNKERLPKTSELTISVGASPQVVSIQNFAGAISNDSIDSGYLSETIRRVTKSTFDSVRTKLELHAGVYTVCDMQQLATNARATIGTIEEEIAASVIAEVCSVYNDSERKRPEALLAIGTLGLGREPCHSYAGWGVLDRQSYSGVQVGRRLIIDRISQEHSIVTWEVGQEDMESETDLPPLPLEIGQRVRIYPNHACITGAMYGWYLVIDSSLDSNGSKILDVWIRATGW